MDSAEWLLPPYTRPASSRSGTRVGEVEWPVLVGLATGERPGALPVLGVLTALPAIWLVSASGSELSGEPARKEFDYGPSTADPKHYKVEFENAQVRVLRITYGPGEKSVMHEHPANVAVFLNEAQAKFTLPDGKTQADTVKAGTALWFPGDKHLPENIGDKPFELILVELKGKATP